MQRKTLRICLGAMKYTPIDALHVEALEPPLAIRREMISGKFIMKQTFFSTPLLTKISTLNTFDLTNKYWIKKSSPPLCSAYRDNNKLLLSIDQNNISETSYFSLFTHVNIITPSYSEIPQISNNILFNVLHQFDQPELIYTDASKSELGTGGAFLVPYKKIVSKHKLNLHCSIFTAEAISIYQALKYVEKASSKVSIILSDSLSVLNGIENIHTFSYKVNPYLYKIKHLISEITSTGREIYFVWVKAHIGLEHNEQVDRLAKASCNLEYLLEDKLCIGDI